MSSIFEKSGVIGYGHPNRRGSRRSAASRGFLPGYFSGEAGLPEPEKNRGIVYIVAAA